MSTSTVQTPSRSRQGDRASLHGKLRAPRRLPLVWLVLAAGLGTAACRPAEPPPEGTPRLLLHVVVDQLRGDALDRFRPLLTGGLARLLDEGVVFTDTHHRHAVTSTGPGHATLATGAYPARHGIVGNQWLDRDDEEWRYCVGHPRHGRSPHRLLVSTLGDWMKRRYPGSKVVAVSGKDRAAVLSGGFDADGAFWYDDEVGGFVTSRYYGRAPAWLEKWGEGGADRFFGTAWEPLAVTRSVLAAGRAPDVETVDHGAFAASFPHPLGDLAVVPDEDFYYDVYDSPFVDELTAEVALAAVRAEDLGGDAVPDLLALGFSAYDTVGHDYGPDSPEALDVLLRVDRLLGELLDALEAKVGPGRLAVSLSSDHGVARLPEVRRARGLPGERLDATGVACFHAVGRELAQRWGDGWASGPGYLYPEAVDTSDGSEIGRERMARELAERLVACPGVEQVWSADGLLARASGPDSRPGARRPAELAPLYAASFHPERSPDVLIQFAETFLPDLGEGTNHGSPHPADTHVPWIVLWPGFEAGRVGRPTATVDVAPTLARLLDVPVPGTVDGKPAPELATR